VDQTLQGRFPERTRPGLESFVLGQLRRPAGLAQTPPRAGLQLAQIKLLWLAMLLIKITAGSAKTTGRPNRAEAAGAVTGAAILRFIDKTLDQQDRMAPALLPVRAQAAQTQGQGA